jgi:hypothetical protein
VGNLDWQYSNVTADATYQFVGDWSDFGEVSADTGKVFEMRGMISF